MMTAFAYQRPGTLKEALEAAGRPGARILAGGTDLLGCLRDGVFEAGRVVSLSGIKELRGIGAAPGGELRIGAMATLSEVAQNAEIRRVARALSEAAASAASPQLRNQGTLGGNLCQRPRCWYFRSDQRCMRKGGETCFAAAGENQHHAILGVESCAFVHPSDTAPALVALDAKLRIAGKQGSRIIPVAQFFPAKEDLTKENVLAPGEIVVEVLLGSGDAAVKSTYRKARDRGAWDFALAGAAVALRFAGGKVERARVVLSGVAGVPWRAVEAEKALEGRALDAAGAAKAAEAAVKGAQPLEKNAYKVALAKGVVEEALLALA